MQQEGRASIRLFFALWPGDDTRAELLRARDAMADSAGAGARPTHPDDLHMTLVFVGAVAPERLPCIESAGDDVVLAPFDLALRRVETWSRQRLLVAVPDAPPPALFNLVAQLQQGLLACGIAPERRRYRPHATLARRAERTAPQPLSVAWAVRGFVLARSGVGAAGAGGYRVLRTWSLDG
jgi:2'-5' RNA ligase